MSPCHPFRPVPGQCGPHRRGPLPAPPFDPRDYWATKNFVSSLFGSLETRLDNLDELYKVDVVDPGTATEVGQAADAKKTQEELNRILAKLAEKADSATTLAGYGITDAATKAELAAKADLVGGKVPAAQLPSYVDDVLEYDAMSAFPATGESGKIYVAKDTNLVYRWSGTQYVEISPSPVLDATVTETSSNGVKSSGVWSWVKSLLPKWLTSDYAEPATAASVAAKADKATTLAGYGITDAVPFVEDLKGLKTAVTIGSRTIGESVGPHSLANGDGVAASGHCSHAEGSGTTASAEYSHAEGVSTVASGDYSHAEGLGSTASGTSSHAEGDSTVASGLGSHAAGFKSRTPEYDDYAFAWNGDGTRGDKYTSHGPGTFNINPVGGLAGFYIGEQKLPQVINAAITGKANLAALAPEYLPTSAYAVGAIVYYGGSIYQCKTAIADGGEAWNAEHWELRKLDDFFTESNSLLNGRLAYSRNATGLKDRAFNTLSFDGTEYNLSTALAAVTPTASGQPRDLLIVATATAATTISFTAGTIKGDKPTIDGSGTWLITLTEYASGVWYCRQIKMEDAA